MHVLDNVVEAFRNLLFFSFSLCKGQTLYTHIHGRKEKLQLNRTVIIASQIAQVNSIDFKLPSYMIMYVSTMFNTH